MSHCHSEMKKEMHIDCDLKDLEAIGIYPPRVEYNHDNVKSPKHYMFFDMEVIDIIKASMTKEQFIGYCKGNAIKYRLRAGKKDDAIQDIAKAEEYEKFYDNTI